MGEYNIKRKSDASHLARENVIRTRSNFDAKYFTTKLSPENIIGKYSPIQLAKYSTKNLNGKYSTENLNAKYSTENVNAKYFTTQLAKKDYIS